MRGYLCSRQRAGHIPHLEFASVKWAINRQYDIVRTALPRYSAYFGYGIQIFSGYYQWYNKHK